MSRRKKPKGELGSLHVGSGSATYQLQDLPSTKPQIEKWVLDSAVHSARSRGTNLYDLVEEPRQNPENDFDFTLSTSRGQEDLDLMEVVLMPAEGGYEGAPTSYHVGAMVTTNLERILGKSRHYGRPARPIHLLLYSTDWRFVLTPGVIAALAASLRRETHAFATITYVYPVSPSSGTVEQVFPRKTPDAEPADDLRSYQVLGDIRRAEVKPDGSVRIPMTIPRPTTASSAHAVPDWRIWICPALCGCELAILAFWGGAPVRDANGRLISDRHPASGTIRTIHIEHVCPAHAHFRTGPPLDETYGGEMPRYLDRPQITEAEKLYVALSRFTGQSRTLDTCDCRLFQTWDRTSPGTIVTKRHPRITRLCSAHAADRDDHSAALENSRRKNEVVRWLVSHFGLSHEGVEWQWTDSRALCVTTRGLTNHQKVDAQAWCDTTLGLDKVIVM